MTKTQNLAEILEIPNQILPYFAQLLSGLWSLGSWPEVILNMVESVQPTPKATVLDLGCGKGAVSLPIAQHLKLKVTGVDLFPPFINEANTRARSMGIEPLCVYKVDDIHTTLNCGKIFDFVIYASIGGVLGDYKNCVSHLRRVCRPGGYMIIDDGYLAQPDPIQEPGYEHYGSLDQVIDQLTAHGDQIIQQEIIPTEKLVEANDHNTNQIRTQALQLSQQHPHLATVFDDYVNWEEQESKLLECKTIPAVWMLLRQ